MQKLPIEKGLPWAAQKRKMGPGRGKIGRSDEEQRYKDPDVLEYRLPKDYYLNTIDDKDLKEMLDDFKKRPGEYHAKKEVESLTVDYALEENQKRMIFDVINKVNEKDEYDKKDVRTSLLYMFDESDRLPNDMTKDEYEKLIEEGIFLESPLRRNLKYKLKKDSIDKIFKKISQEETSKSKSMKEVLSFYQLLKPEQVKKYYFDVYEKEKKEHPDNSFTILSWYNSGEGLAIKQPLNSEQIDMLLDNMSNSNHLEKLYKYQSKNFSEKNYEKFTQILREDRTGETTKYHKVSDDPFWEKNGLTFITNDKMSKELEDKTKEVITGMFSILDDSKEINKIVKDSKLAIGIDLSYKGKRGQVYSTTNAYYRQYSNAIYFVGDKNFPSLAHEFGHFLDYQAPIHSKGVRGARLIETPEFKEYFKFYKEKHGIYDSKYRDSKTEVFARAFERYCYNKYTKNKKAYNINEKNKPFSEYFGDVSPSESWKAETEKIMTMMDGIMKKIDIKIIIKSFIKSISVKE